ncbi:MAG: Hsp70 family protein [Polyangiales bacterium]
MDPSVRRRLSALGRLHRGNAARERRPIDPKNTIYSAKRLIGESLTSYRTQEFRRNYPFDLTDTERGAVGFRTRAGVFTSRDIATRVVDELLARTRYVAEKTVAVVTVPAAFTDVQRSTTRRALRNAGIPQVRMVEEPVATAIAYLQRSNLRYAVVYDLGGGTFDLAILDCTRRPFQILAHGGDPYLGGDDIDRVIANWITRSVLERTGWDVSTDREVFDRLVMTVESAKRELTTRSAVTIDLSNIDPAAPQPLGSIELDRTRALGLASDLVRRTFAICDDVLGRAGLHARDMDAVFLAGGSTALPGVKEHVEQYFGKRPRTDVPPMESVAIGASLAAARPALAGLLEEDETNA